MSFILRLANQATKIREVVIILDCCHAGALGQAPLTGNNQASLREGISILASSKDGQTSVESVDGGLFTSTVCDALDGGAADILGNVTVASIYEYVEQLFGANDQRPMLKSHISRIFPLRKCKPAISLETLKKLPTHFLNADDEFPLDPSFEPTADPKHEEREMIFSRLQKYCAARLLVPVSEEHMYYAAMNSKSCKLTPLGKYYWRLAKDGKFGPPDDSYI